MKIISLFFVLIQFICGFTYKAEAKTIRLETNKADLQLKAKAHLLIDYDSKEVLYSSNEHEKLYPASMTKMMGMLLVLEHIEKGKLKWDDMVTPSQEACSMGGTQIFLAPNESMSVEDLFKSVAINSANDAVVALGEKVAGSHSSFVKMMNEKAKNLKMNDTNFVNATGFDDEKHYTSAYDMGLLATELLRFNESILRFTRLKEDYIRKDSDEPFWLVNTNKLLGHYDGMDGLKTGYTNKAGYNLTATAIRNGIRLVSVTMGAASIADRSSDTRKLLDYGYSILNRVELFYKDEILALYDFKNAKNRNVAIYPLNDIAPSFIDNVKKEDLTISIVLTKTSAPIAKDTVVGYLVIAYKDKEKRYPVVVKEDVINKKYLDYFKDAWVDLFI